MAMSFEKSVKPDEFRKLSPTNRKQAFFEYLSVAGSKTKNRLKEFER